jgi:hypothetical protein
LDAAGYESNFKPAITQRIRLQGVRIQGRKRVTYRIRPCNLKVQPQETQNSQKECAFVT